MRLTAWEEERLLVFTAAELARRHRERGLLLNAPEAIAIIGDAMFEAARAGASFAEVETAGRGAVRLAPDELPDPTAGLERRRLEVRSTSRRVIRVSSHFPFHRVNRRLEFDRGAAAGFRLDLPAGGSERWGPGEVRTVELVRYAAGPADP